MNTMTRTQLLSALALAGLVSQGAQAATWTLGASAASGMRTGVVALTDTLGSLGSTGDSQFGTIDNDLNEITVDSVAVGSWDSASAVLGGNSIDLGMSHEIYASAAYQGAPQTAYANLMSSVSLDNAQIVDAGLDLDFSGYAPARLTQSYLIAPELGESLGQWVNVDLFAWADHTQSGNLSGDSLNFAQDFLSSYTLYLNGSVIDAGSFDALGYIGGTPWSFLAHIGDEVELEIRSQSQIAGAAIGLALGDTPQMLATSEAFVSLTITPVPEPETWAMFVIGLGLMGLQVRRKTTTNQKLGVFHHE